MIRTISGLIWLIFGLLLLAACNDAAETDSAPTETSPPVTLAAGEIIPPTSPVTPRPGQADASGDRPTPTPAVTAAPTEPPTATPIPADRLALGLRYFETGNYEAAIEQLNGALNRGLAVDQEQQARYGLGQAYLATGHYGAAVEILNQYLAQSSGPQANAPLGQSQLSHPDVAYALLANAYQGSGDGEAARNAYQTYLLANPDMAFYIQSAIADSYLLAGDRPAAAAARERALGGAAHKNAYAALLYQQGDYYLDEGDYAAAAAQYVAILDVAVTDATRSDALYQAGRAELLAGNETTAYELFEQAFVTYPESYTSYLALVELVEAGIVVDEYQRGLVDYHAGAYQPALEAFARYISAQEAVSATIPADIYRWQAYSHEGLGDIPAAVSALDRYGVEAPASAALEQAQLYFRNDRWEDSRLSYISYTEAYSQTTAAPEAAWWAARLTEIFGASEEAAERYELLADRYPASADVPRALFRAGLLWSNEGLDEAAAAAWSRLAAAYPGSQFTAAAAIWLARSGLDDTALDQYKTRAGFSYYHLRAQDLAVGAPPFAPVSNLNLVTTSAEQSEAEEWLQAQLGLAEATDLSSLSSPLLNDARLIRGWKLWQLGRLELAKQELEAVRVSYNTDAVATYQLALFFREIGLYRSSILAGANLLGMTSSNVFDAPRFLAALVYPIHFADLVVPLAGKYSYDPLLQFALIRQESLYETFISSPVGAQGLSQVMPATGEYIAGQLGWPNYQTSLLLDPYVGLNFGAFYLHQQLEAFDGSIHAALAAYNAGPGNSARWYAVAGDDLDAYFEAIDFIETRLYIERIYVGHAIYRHLYGGDERG